MILEDNERTRLLLFIQRVFVFHGPEKLLLDSPVFLAALDKYRPEVTANIQPSMVMHECRIERWIFPHGELIVPLDDATELQKHVKPENIIREQDFPDEVAALLEPCPSPLK